MKQSGKNLNLKSSKEGQCYTKVKKSLKNTVTRATRAKLKRDTRTAAQKWAEAVAMFGPNHELTIEAKTAAEAEWNSSKLK